MERVHGSKSAGHPERVRAPQRGASVGRGAAHLQQALGNRGVERLLRAKLAQAKLTVSQPDDVHEQEADRVADAVMRMPASATAYGSQEFVQEEGVTPVQAKLAREPLVAREAMAEEPPTQEEEQRQDEEEDLVQAKAAPTGSVSDVDGEVEGRIRSLSGRGSALPDSTRTFLGPRFGADFGDVRVHDDAASHTLARSVRARAFTIGHDIVFGEGEYAPHSTEGRRLIAHELTHVLQQTGGSGSAALAPKRLRGDRRPGEEDQELRVDRRAAEPRSIAASIAQRGRTLAVDRTVTGLAVAGAAAEVGQPDHFVVPRGPGALVVTATTSAAGQAVTWTGGSAQPGNPLARRVTTGTARTVNLTADTPADPGSHSAVVHIVNGAAAPANTPAALQFSRQPGNPPALAPFGLTDVRTNAPVPLIRAFLDGDHWVFRVNRISHRYLLGVTGGGNTNIPSSGSATAANHCQVVADLTPPAAGAATGPARANFWSQPITVAHENAHVARFYSPPFWEAFMRVAEAAIEAPASNVNVDHTVPATLAATSVVTANAAAHQAVIDAQHALADAAEFPGAETFAHDQSNPMYTTLVAQIRARFRPLAPTALAAVAAGPANVALNWTHNACNETEYRVFRRRGTGAFAQIATLPAGSVAFTDTLPGLVGGTAFSYRITAAGVAGQSNPSNTVNVVTP